MKFKFLLFSSFLLVFSVGFILLKAPFKANKKDHLITISTSFGEMKFILYDSTPLHKENFIKLAKEGFYDSTTFHRVMNQFMIQGGDPNSKDSNPNNDGLGGPGYTIKAEFDTSLYHKKGVLAAARQPDAVNPQKESNGSQFYIVQGRPVLKNDLSRMASFKKINYSEAQKETYYNLGGTPHLDGDYTIFGEIISGMNIIDSIAAVKVNRANRPFENVYMRVSAELLKKKKITKLYNYSYPDEISK